MSHDGTPITQVLSAKANWVQFGKDFLKVDDINQKIMEKLNENKD